MEKGTARYAKLAYLVWPQNLLLLKDHASHYVSILLFHKKKKKKKRHLH